MKRVIAVLLALALLCGGCAAVEPPSGSAPEPASRSADTPADLIGEPQGIYIFRDGEETLFADDTQEYADILTLLEARFPDGLKEAQRAITWTDESGELELELLEKEFHSYLRLTYGVSQTVQMNCMHENYKDLPVKELTFRDIVFPLSEPDNALCIIGTQASYGVLDNSIESLSAIWAYCPASDL